MPTAYVTGGTGFVGVNLVFELIARGWDVTAIHRANSDLRYLKRTGARLMVADVTDAASLLASIPQRVDCVFHVAGDTNFWKYANARQTRNNVEGTRNMVAAAIARGAVRYVQTSSTAAFGLHEGVCIDESTWSTAKGSWINYLRTKWLADEEVRAGVMRGLDAVILHPANILGPHDRHAWAYMFVLLKQGRVPGIPPGRSPWCHVRDVVAAHIGAAERGRTGESYLLGGPVEAFSDVMHRAAVLIGVRPPRPLPKPLLRGVGRVSQWWSFISRRPPDVTPEIAHILSSAADCNSSKAARELGYSTCSVDDMVRDTHAWLTAEGML